MCVRYTQRCHLLMVGRSHNHVLDGPHPLQTNLAALMKQLRALIKVRMLQRTDADMHHARQDAVAVPVLLRAGEQISGLLAKIDDEFLVISKKESSRQEKKIR